MYVPPARHGLHLPEPVITAGLWILAVAIGLAAWGMLSTASIRTDDSYLTRDAPALFPVDPSSFNAVAYTTRGDFADQVWLHPLSGDAEPTMIATVPHIYSAGVLANADVDGAVSPRGDAIALLSVTDSAEARSYAELSILSLTTGEMRTGFGPFDSLSPLAWSPDGLRLALVRSEPADESGRRASSIVEVDLVTGTSTVVAHFTGVFEAAPVGYSVNADRLYIVTVDNGGSTLFVEAAGELTPSGSLSGGRTRDWTLNADATRLAYIEALSASERAYVGRMFHIGVGEQSQVARIEGMQLGAAWRPGSPLPDFGSLDGEVWQLDPAPESPVFVWPLAWSPDGSTLITSIHNVEDGRVAPQGALELVVSNERVLLEDGARFLGFVRGE